MSASIDVNPFLEKLKERREAGIAAIMHAADVVGEQVIGDAQQLAPVDTGTLAGSGTPNRTAASIAADSPVEKNGVMIEKKIGFNTTYAAAVHERLDVHHDQGQAKFLEAALQNNAEKGLTYIGNKLKEAVGE